MSHDIIFDEPDPRDIIRTAPPASDATSTAADAPHLRRQDRRRRQTSLTKPSKPPRPPKPPPETQASPQARRTAAVLLEVLAGLRATGSAAQELGVTPMRYYQIEERAIGGLIVACEPRPSGLPPERRDAQELAKLREQMRRQTQELNQARSVLRTTQRQLGVATAVGPIVVKGGTAGKGGAPTKHKVRRPTVRALTMVRRLLKADAAALTDAASTGSSNVPTSTPEPGGG